MLSDPLRCDEVTTLLAAAVDDPTALSPTAAEHVERCLRCQAEQVQYRRIRRTMLTMQQRVEAPDPRLLDDVLDLLRPPAPVHKIGGSDRRRAAIGGIAAAATAGAAGAIVVASRLVGGRRLAS